MTNNMLEQIRYFRLASLLAALSVRTRDHLVQRWLAQALRTANEESVVSIARVTLLSTTDRSVSKDISEAIGETPDQSRQALLLTSWKEGINNLRQVITYQVNKGKRRSIYYWEEYAGSHYLVDGQRCLGSVNSDLEAVFFSSEEAIPLGRFLTFEGAAHALERLAEQLARFPVPPEKVQT